MSYLIHLCDSFWSFIWSYLDVLSFKDLNCSKVILIPIGVKSQNGILSVPSSLKYGNLRASSFSCFELFYGIELLLCWMFELNLLRFDFGQYFEFGCSNRIFDNCIRFRR